MTQTIIAVAVDCGDGYTAVEFFRTQEGYDEAAEADASQENPYCYRYGHDEPKVIMLPDDLDLNTLGITFQD
jgi:hypothetical protein